MLFVADILRPLDDLTVDVRRAGGDGKLLPAVQDGRRHLSGAVWSSRIALGRFTANSPDSLRSASALPRPSDDMPPASAQLARPRSAGPDDAFHSSFTFISSLSAV